MRGADFRNECEMPAGRPSTYTEEIAADICTWIAEGKALAAYCRERGVGYSTVTQWLQAHPEFAANYTQARVNAAEADADLVSDIRDRCIMGEIDPQAARVAIDAAKWTAGKRMPKKYGERVVQEHVGADGGPIRNVSMTVEEFEAVARKLADAV